MSLSLLRDEMKKHRLDAYVIRSEDAHGTEYPAQRFQRRAFISGFSGSAGDAVVFANAAFLLVDPRYWELAPVEAGKEWEIVKLRDPAAPITLEEFICKQLEAGAVVGCHGEQFTVSGMRSFKTALNAKGLHVVTTPQNLVDSLWNNRPALPDGGFQCLDDDMAGESVASKLERLRKRIKENSCSAILVSALDEVMWLFNVRGADSVSSPVIYSYALVTDSAAHLFIHPGRTPVAAEEVLTNSGVTIRDYDTVAASVKELASKPGTKVWIDSATVNWDLWSAVEDSDGVISKESPIALWKALKNKAEQDGMRNCHIRDAVAKTRFLAWLEQNAGVTEIEACEKLLEFRRKEKWFVGRSFDTILGAGENAAVIHYRPDPARPRVVGANDVVLIDSGGHYLDGTTDVTRTIHMGTPTVHQKRCYTRVLQGHVNLAKAVVRSTTAAHQLDILARLPLYSDGLDYLHGTGHGVGAFLNVHEYPPLISGGVTPASSAKIMEGMIFSDEPGYYEEGSFGIRIESLLLTRQVNTLYHFGKADYLGFENLTLIPFCRKLIDVSLLSEDQVRYIDAFHKACYEKVSPHLKLIGDETAIAFLKRETLPLRGKSLIRTARKYFLGVAAVTSLTALYWWWTQSTDMIKK